MSVVIGHLLCYFRVSCVAPYIRALDGSKGLVQLTGILELSPSPVVDGCETI